MNINLKIHYHGVQAVYLGKMLAVFNSKTFITLIKKNRFSFLKKLTAEFLGVMAVQSWVKNTESKVNKLYILRFADPILCVFHITKICNVNIILRAL